MNIQQDFREFLLLLERYDVDYMVIGRKELLKNKSSTDRLKDKADVEEINRANET